MAVVNTVQQVLILMQVIFHKDYIKIFKNLREYLL